MTHSIIKRYIALLLSLMIFVSSTPLQTFAQDGQSHTPSIGIINTLFSERDDTECKYKVTLYKDNEPLRIIDDFTFSTDDSENVYLNAAGEIYIPKDVTVNFLDNAGFREYLKENEITKLTIEFLEYEYKDHAFHLYSINGTETNDHVVEYELTRIETVPVIDSDTGEPVVDSETGDTETENVTVFFDITDEHFRFSAADFKSTEMNDYEVNVLWHDRGENRPDVTFDVKANGVEYKPVAAYDQPVKTVVNSNNDVYVYCTPKYDKNGDLITYTSEINSLPSTDEWRVTKNEDIYDYYAQRSFDFTMKWKDGAEKRHLEQFCENNSDLIAKVNDYISNSDTQVTKDQIQKYIDNVIDFITHYFDVKKVMNNDDYEIIDPAEINQDGSLRHKITFDPKENSISIGGLDDISQTGEVEIYCLEKKNSEQKLSAAGKDTADLEDYWNVKMENTGVNSANTDQLFHDAIMDLLLSGDTDIIGTVQWDDEDRAAERKQDANRGNLYLWRYTTDTDYSAQAASQPLAADSDGFVVPSEDIHPFSFENYPKYDIDGFRYTYYVKESLNRPDYKYYQILYTDSADQPTTTMPNGGTIINRLSDDIIFAVHAKWVAAARQGGTPVSATYLIQEYKDGEWVNTKVNGQDVTMTIPNFGAETMVLTKEFGQEVPMYDERGRRIQYRIVQTYVTRTDYGFTGFYDEVVYNQEEPTIITLHNNDTDGDKYAVTITPPLPTNQTYTYDFEYRLTGEYDIYIEKVWDDKKIPIIRRNIP